VNSRNVLTILLLVLLFASCSPNTNLPTSDHAVFQITKVVDKLTGEPIPKNKIWIEIEQQEGETLEFSDENIRDHRIEVPVGAIVFVRVEAPGYVDWELVVRFKAPKYMETPVEMRPTGEQGSISIRFCRRTKETTNSAKFNHKMEKV
jgi:TATA-binding protein-associated factor Taf7